MRFTGPGVDEHDRLGRAGATRVLRRSLPLLRPYRAQMAVAGLLVAGWTLAKLAGPLLVRRGIDIGIKRGDAGELDLAVVAYVVISVVAFALDRVQIAMIGRIGEGFLRDLRNQVFVHLLRLSMPFYDREKAGVIVSRMTSDIDSLSELVQTGLLLFIGNALLLVASIVVLALVSWQLLLVSALTLPLVIVASVKFQRDANKAYLTVRDRIGATLSQLQEGIAGVRVIQAFGREDREVDRFARNNQELYEAHMESVRVSAWYIPVVEAAGVVSTAAAVGFGGWLVSEGTVTVGTVTFFVLTLSNLFEPVQQLSQLFNVVQAAGASLRKLYDVLDTEPEVLERPGAVPLPPDGAVELRGVSFTYAGSDRAALQDVDLVIEPGERLAVVGPTGAGKSTLAKLVARLYDPVEGRVCFGGVDLRRATLRSLRERIAVVPQEGFLFNGTVADNVRLGRPDASDGEVATALASIGVLERFQRLPDGLATEVRERGSRLSAGERQLVSLARAALADPTVLVLDEATSSLDPGTEVLVETAMARLTDDRTVIVVAHRLSTAARADRVAVVDGARLVELGTHAELVGRGGRYADLYANWVGGMSQLPLG